MNKWKTSGGIAIVTIIATLAMPAMASGISSSLSEIRVSAEVGDIEAQYELGIAYADGNGAPQNYRVAFYWLLKAALAENADAEYEVGMLYKEGLGVAQSNKLAFDWINRSAQQGNAEAQYELGTLYQSGTGIRTSPEKAFKWYKEACENGSESGCNKTRKIRR